MIIATIPRVVFAAAIERGIANMTRDGQERFGAALRVRAQTALRSAVGLTLAGDTDACPMAAIGMRRLSVGDDESRDFNRFASEFDRYIDMRLERAVHVVRIED